MYIHALHSWSYPSRMNFESDNKIQRAKNLQIEIWGLRKAWVLLTLEPFEVPKCLISNFNS